MYINPQEEDPWPYRLLPESPWDKVLKGCLGIVRALLRDPPLFRGIPKGKPIGWGTLKRHTNTKGKSKGLLPAHFMVSGSYPKCRAQEKGPRFVTWWTSFRWGFTSTNHFSGGSQLNSCGQSGETRVARGFYEKSTPT